MAQISPNAISKKPACTSTEQASIIDISPKPTCTSTKHAFQYCLSIDSNTRFYKEIPNIFFIRPTNRMKKPLENAAALALNLGTKSVCNIIKKRDDIGDDSDSESHSDASRSSDDTRPPRHCSY